MSNQEIAEAIARIHPCTQASLEDAVAALPPIRFVFEVRLVDH